MEWPPHLLSVGDLTCIALVELLERAERMKADATGFTVRRGSSRPEPRCSPSATAGA
ncbi:MAG TPA: hypothetical protein VHJ39_01600 [Solirubrobacteraceae bacterium]|jgi:hypothetical protein|nr:hypothetical protein [Solirubrobacteraceae bacterium]